MSAATETPTPTTEPSRSGLLLGLIRKLIDYGRELATTIRQRVAADPIFAKARFGTTDLAVIFARIAHGLHLADALEARVLRCAARLDAKPAPGRARSAARAPAAPRVAAEADPRLAHLPTAEQIAAEIRRRPIGAVIADICRDLGINGSHPLWREVHHAMLRHGGSFVALMNHIIDQAFPLPARLLPSATRAASRPPVLRPEAPGGTGPP
jgi:hypothetical protein